MFAKLHLLSQDVPEGGDAFRWKAHPYLRMAGAVPKGPAVFEWNARQRTDLEALWRDPATDGARDRLAKDLAAFCEKLGWTADAEELEEGEKNGRDYILTLSAVPPELYILPWEVIEVGATGTYLSDYASAQVRYSMPGLGPRELQTAPSAPGVLFAWSSAGGAVPHDEQGAAIRAAAEAGGVAFREVAEVDEHSLQAALDAGPLSVLHLLCHGLPGVDGEPSRLKWGASDNPSEITAPRLARMLRRHEEAIRLVVLSACGSGDGRGDPLFMASLAQELHKKGIPSVVASRYPLSLRGSRVMTRALYDKMLREAWSLERALRHARQTLFRVDDDGEAHPGDAYGIQLYTHDTEWFVSDNQIEAERPVLASYPFGIAARPVPASAPPAAELTMSLEGEPELSPDEVVDRLRRVSEDERLVVVIRTTGEQGAISLVVHTTVDGAQRLLGAWRSKALKIAVGVIVGALVLTKGIATALGSTLGAAAAGGGAAAAHLGAAVGQAGAAAGGGAGAAAAHVGAAVGQAGAAAGGGAGAAAAHVGAAAGSAGAGAGTAAGSAGAGAGTAAGSAGAGAGAAAGSAGTGAGATAGGGASAGAAAGGGTGAAGAATGSGAGIALGQGGVAASKVAATIASIAGKVITSKIAIAAVVGSVAVAGGAAMYRAETRPAPRAELAATQRPTATQPQTKAESPRPMTTSPTEVKPEAAPTNLPAQPLTREPSPAANVPVPRSPTGQPATTAGPTTVNRPVPTGSPNATPAPTTAGPATPVTTQSPGATTMQTPGATTTSGPLTGSTTGPTTRPSETTMQSPDSTTGSGPTTQSPGPNTTQPPGSTTGAGPVTRPTTQPPGSATTQPPGPTTGAPGSTTAQPPGPSPGDPGANEPGPSSSNQMPTGTAPPRATETPVATTAVCGNSILEPGEQCDDGNTRDGDGCSPACQKHIWVDPRTLRDQLISGNQNISPSQKTKDSMLRYHLDHLNGTVALCINTAGKVMQSSLQVQSGYPEYDQKLVMAVLSWRYRPYLIDDRPAAVCSTVQFLYNAPRAAPGSASEPASASGGSGGAQ